MLQTADNVILNSLMTELAEIKAALIKSRINEYSQELWTIDDIAEYFKFSRLHIERVIKNDIYFPKPVRLPSQRNVKQNSSKALWFSGEIVRYAMRRQCR